MRAASELGLADSLCLSMSVSSDISLISDHILAAITFKLSCARKKGGSAGLKEAGCMVFLVFYWLTSVACKEFIITIGPLRKNSSTKSQAAF